MIRSAGPADREIDAVKQFDRIKRDHLLAVAAVTAARAELSSAIRRAAESAESTRAAAESAANQAAASAAHLALEARAAAESARLHHELTTTTEAAASANSSKIPVISPNNIEPYSSQ